MRVLPVLLALAVGFAGLTALSGCHFERVAPTPDADPTAAESFVPSPNAPPGTQPPPPPEALTNPRMVDGKPEVVLYVTEWCPYCAQAREYMAAEDIPHRIVDIEKDEGGAREYRARGGTGGIPLVAVGTKVMEGWSADVAEGMLEEAGYAAGP